MHVSNKKKEKRCFLLFSGCLFDPSSFKTKTITDAYFHIFVLQLYMAPVTHSERYNEAIDFWRNVYGIDSENTSNIPTYNVLDDDRS